MAVEGYLAECDVLAGTGEKDRRVLIPRGEVTPERLAAATAGHGESLYLRFVQEPLAARAHPLAAPPEPRRLPDPGSARVGLFARLVDAGFTASLLLRGTVPGGTAAAASVKYEAIRATDGRYVYHARVLRQDGWIVLHYVFFYAMNDWRSTFLGANDHEADWEQLFVFLDDAPGGPVPAWVACAAHDYTGDDLRRRWDDPTLAKDGTHPLINPGGGSHAAYFEQGDYLTAAPVPGLSRLRGPLAVLRGFWHNTLRQPDPGDLAAKLEGSLNVGFIDYGRGNGLAIGPGGDVAVDADPDRRLASPGSTATAGLFGLDTYDRFAGERAPAGPKYNRNGTRPPDLARPAGLGRARQGRPAERAPEVLEERIAALDAEASRARRRRSRPPARRCARTSWRSARWPTSPRWRGSAPAGSRRSRAAEAAQAARRRRKVDLAETARAAREELVRIRAGDWGDPRAHLRHEHHPIPAEETRYGILVELWSAISVSLLLVATIALIYLGILSVLTVVLVVIAAYAFVEAAFQRRLTTLLLRLTLLLAVIGAIVLAVTYATEALVIALIGLAVIILLDNVRELRGR